MTTNTTLPALSQLAAYLFSRRELLSNNWRSRCQDDALMPAGANLTREEFNDRVPELLNILNEQLQARSDETDICQKAGEHGFHRWHKAYTLIATLAELMDLARLEAGQQKLTLSQFDVAKELQKWVQDAQPLANQRGLTLQGDGPGSLVVQDESVENLAIMQRINKLFTDRPELGVRQVQKEISTDDNSINIKRIHRLMSLIRCDQPTLPIFQCLLDSCILCSY